VTPDPTTPGRRALISALTLVLAAAGPTLIGFTTAVGPFWALMLFGGIALILAAIAIQAVQVLRDSRRIKSVAGEREDMRRQMRDALKPIPELIAQLPALSYGERAHRLQGIAQACATALYMLVSPHADQVRANVFALEEDPDRMEWLAHVGRGQTPRPFISGTARGDSALAFITKLQPVFYPDLTVEQPEGYEGSMSDYETFISVPIWSDQAVYGMATIDAPARNALTAGDQHLVELVAELMATAFVVANI
jgi:GAF domain-containing protein